MFFFARFWFFLSTRLSKTSLILVFFHPRLHLLFFFVFFRCHDLWSLPGAGWFTVNAHSIKQVCFCQVSSRPSGCHGHREAMKKPCATKLVGRPLWMEIVVDLKLCLVVPSRSCQLCFYVANLHSVLVGLVSPFPLTDRPLPMVRYVWFFFGGKFLWQRSVGAHGLQSRDVMLLNTLGTCHAVECTRRCGLLCGRTFTGEPDFSRVTIFVRHSQGGSATADGALRVFFFLVVKSSCFFSWGLLRTEQQCSTWCVFGSRSVRPFVFVGHRSL